MRFITFMHFYALVLYMTQVTRSKNQNFYFYILVIFLNIIMNRWYGSLLYLKRRSKMAYASMVKGSLKVQKMHFDTFFIFPVMHKIPTYTYGFTFSYTIQSFSKKIYLFYYDIFGLSILDSYNEELLFFMYL